MLGRVVAEAADRWGDTTVAIAAGGRTMTYAELDRWSDELAVGLHGRGIEPGDVVMLALDGGPTHLVAYAGINKAGAICSSVNPRLSRVQRQTVVEASKARLVLATEELRPEHADVVRVGAFDADDVLSGLRRPAPERWTPAGPDPDRPVAIVFTSGTTGPPKGALFCERQLEFIRRIDTGGRWGGGGVSLSGTSPAHLGPMTKLPGTLMRGGTTCFMEKWSASTALELTERHQMAQVAGIPTQIALMLRDPSFAERDLTSVRVVVMGGGPATPALVREARARFDAPVTTRYACTEAGIGLGTGVGDPPEDAELTVGRPHDGVEVAVRNPDGIDVEPGDTGEVCLRSPAVMTGYWGDPAATDRARFPDGFVRTGDLGAVDDLGRLRLVGRATDRYVRGGYNVHPGPVESALADHPGIAEVAVVGVDDEIMGQVGAAFVVPTDPRRPPTLADLRAYAADRLARHELPERLVVTDRIPRTPGDKVDRRALAAWPFSADSAPPEGARSAENRSPGVP